MTNSWLPLEANPELLTEYSRTLGLPADVRFHDVLSVDAWALEMVPNPIQAFLLLFPLSADDTACCKGGSAKCTDIVFMRQFVGNACGTIALLHAMLNLHERRMVTFSQDSYVARMYDSIQGLDPEERGVWLSKDAEIANAHASIESEGQSVVSNGDVDTHFIAFIPSRDGPVVIELDGRKNGPVYHAPGTESDPFGLAVLDVIKREFISKNPNDIRFSILALSYHYSTILHPISPQVYPNDLLFPITEKLFSLLCNRCLGSRSCKILAGKIPKH
jgi:ubiquitin carboxyl-terminal hydrolase L3